MSEQTQQAIGKILTDSEQRDAIHFAVAPVVAGEVLKPGTHVGFTQSNQEVVGAKGVHIGVIDPFLKAPVRVGDRCWLFLYPRRIEMENQHKQIIGYRDLSQEEIDLMNMVKGLAAKAGAELEIVNAAPDTDKRWVAIARTHLQEGFMALTRSIAKPTSF